MEKDLSDAWPGSLYADASDLYEHSVAESTANKTFEGNNRSNCDSIFQGAFLTTKVKEQCLLASPRLPTRAIEMPGHMSGGCHVVGQVLM